MIKKQYIALPGKFRFIGWNLRPFRLEKQGPQLIKLDENRDRITKQTDKDLERLLVHGREGVELLFKIDMDWRNNYAFTTCMTITACSDERDFQGGGGGQLTFKGGKYRQVEIKYSLGGINFRGVGMKSRQVGGME